MCVPGMGSALAALLTAGAGSAALSQGKPKLPPQQQPAKKPDEGLSEEERRKRLIARLAANSGKTSASGPGGVPNVATGSVKLGG